MFGDRAVPVAEAQVVLIPVPFATSPASRSQGAPEAIRQAAAGIGLHDPVTGNPFEAGIAMAQVDPGIQACRSTARGLEPDDAAWDGLTSDVDIRVGRAVEAVLARSGIPGIVGGDHAVAFGAIEAACRRHPELGVLHIGAQPHLHQVEGRRWSRDAAMFNVRTRIAGLGPIVQAGIRDLSPLEARLMAEWEDLTVYTDADLAWALAGGSGWDRLAARIVRPLPARVWITFDVQGLEPQHCPGAERPVPGGLRWREAMVLLRSVAEHDHRIVGFDVCEVAPERWDAAVGARLLYKLAGWALATA